MTVAVEVPVTNAVLVTVAFEALKQEQALEMASADTARK